MRVDGRRLVPALLCLVVMVGGIGILLRSGSSGHDLPAGSQPSIGRETPATAMNMVTMPANNSPTLARDPTDDQFLVLANRRDGPQFGCALDASHDGGRSWVPVQPVPRLPSGADRCYAPEIDFDRAGHLHYLFVGLHGAGNAPIGVFLTTTSDRGSHFSSPRQVLGAERYQVRMVIDRDHGDGRLHLVWLEARSSPTFGGFGSPPNPIMSAYSDDGGATFSHPRQVSDPDRQRVVAPAVAVTGDHELHVLYYDLGDDARDYQGLEGPVWDGTWTLVLSSSHDAGDHFGRGLVIDAGVAPIQRAMLIYTLPPPALAADGTHLYAAWSDARNGDWDVLFRASADEGATWTQPRRLNDDPVHDGRHQYLPRLSVAPTGRLDAIFYDRRGDPLNLANDLEYTYSTDHGNSFSRNLKVTTAPSFSLIGPQYANTSAQGLVEFGGRLGLASDADGAVAAWTDTRNDERAPRAQDIFSARLTFATSEPPAWWRVLGLALSIAGGAALAIIAARWWGARARPRSVARRPPSRRRP